MRGRKPKPTALRVIEGNPGKRPLKDNEPKPKPLLGGCPKHLTGDARQAWQHYAALGYWLTEVDSCLLEVLCVNIGIWKEARAIIKQEGIIDDSKPTLRAHPALKVAADAEKIMLRICQDLGFTPATRSRLNLPAPDDDDDWDF
ncbi:MAG: phage terminase small subunit P27 family [Thermoleophilia bacterium]|nr:phage terminase small subunit P27 family [Thermoleophilia bacterium]